ncbi:C2H2 finger domain protein [Aspergillus sclerotioniger CBS 115572]|uniref:C2H2 finger domain protein n=1 Tax=Aspergillus sclerotioniger CBS 115572 TaxID=1450535 RepID=A0A317VAD4_9EURO|nr:C2H2 finger domain protein [Aspergillus sclerotioniger CBS 115572]PWY71055.1 C2H2 finger domain protein [Aspergillus sclerotioniger CBS 115572]
MQSHGDNPDFVLFPTHFTGDNKMLALDSSRQQQVPYFPPFPMDPTFIDPLATFHVDDLSGFAQTHDPSSAPQSSNYGTTPIYSDSYFDANKAAGFPSMPATPPSLPYSSDHFIPGLSTASGPSIASASSSAIGSPNSGSAHVILEDWIQTPNGLRHPTAVMSDYYSNECFGNALDSDSLYQQKCPESFVDPSVIQPMLQQLPHLSPPDISFPDQSDFILAQGGFLPQSPDPSHLHPAESYTANQPFAQPASVVPTSSPSMMHSIPQPRPVSAFDRRSSISSVQSQRSHPSPAASNAESEDDSKEKGRCPFPECRRVFKDLKAHILTHQSERPEKCPIVTCEYHVKGFARKYDKNRHTLTHYKGTMVCGFCPGSGSPAEKSFNRADVFKRHLTSVHGVEQTPPNCRKRSPGASASKGASGYNPDATGKCSTCSMTFSNAQDFYEHLDDCVLRVVQQEEPSEAINQKLLAEVESDEEVQKTMEKHNLYDTAGTVELYNDELDDDDDDAYEFSKPRSGKGSLKTTKGNSGAVTRPILGVNNAVSKHSSNATAKMRATTSKRRNNRDRYPQSWGCPSSSIKTKKRVLCVFDGQRRLWKDEMMLDNEFEVRVKLPGGAGDGTTREAYVTDLDVETLKRAEGVLSASEEERGPWIDNQSTQLIGQPAVLLPDMYQPHDAEMEMMI